MRLLDESTFPIAEHGFPIGQSVAVRRMIFPSMLVDRIRVVYEDDAVIVVEKPAGLLTIATETEKTRTAYALLREAANRKRPPEKIFIVHRLDREVSGLVVFAKTVEAKEKLQEQFRDHSAGRRYVAVVEGRVS